MTTPWVIVGCGKRKRTECAPAADLYTGPYVRQAVAWARTVTTADRLLILSGKYGLIPGTQVIEPYNATLSRARWAQSPDLEPPVGLAQTARQIDALGLAGRGRVIVLAGVDYLRHLAEASNGSLVPVNPFANLCYRKWGNRGQGYQMQMMKASRGTVPSG